MQTELKLHLLVINLAECSQLSNLYLLHSLHIASATLQLNSLQHVCMICVCGSGSIVTAGFLARLKLSRERMFSIKACIFHNVSSRDQSVVKCPLTHSIYGHDGESY